MWNTRGMVRVAHRTTSFRPSSGLSAAGLNGFTDADRYSPLPADWARSNTGFTKGLFRVETWREYAAAVHSLSVRTTRSGRSRTATRSPAMRLLSFPAPPNTLDTAVYLTPT